MFCNYRCCHLYIIFLSLQYACKKNVEEKKTKWRDFRQQQQQTVVVVVAVAVTSQFCVPIYGWIFAFDN
ncbi:hypothetical protein T03_16624 [Trichinella britovi]|uniref:Uncharacterized protein n=1 Tax=Trichinella britovi TaxID=45882 RepID=A0A0V1CVW1_TRIBR|nr:hypothetical protein T03_16624 [Trichinella britovi]